MCATIVAALLSGCSGSGGDAAGLCRRAYALFDDDYPELTREQVTDRISEENLGAPGGLIGDLADDLRAADAAGDGARFGRTVDALLSTCDGIQ